MTLKKLPEDALPVGDHWEWQTPAINIHGWADDNDLLHREGAPAEIWYTEDGTIRRELWYLHGKLHREGAPTEISYSQDGTIAWEWWYLHGEPHREGAPAGIMYWEDGTIKSESWYLHGQIHREGAPAEIRYRQDGTIWSESWYLHGEEMEIEPEYSRECYQDLQARIGRPAMWTLPGNLIPVLSGFLQ